MSHKLSQTEENYLKAIFTICEKGAKVAGTNSISVILQTAAASVTDMLKRLADKDLIFYEKYKGVTLTEDGKIAATRLLRKHRLWETFLVQKLNFSWDKVHDIAEQLEHIKSPELVERLDDFLGNPKFDPHGEPIPNAAGEFTFRRQINLFNAAKGDKATVVGVQDDSEQFLQYLNRQNLQLGSKVEILEKFPYDQSLKILLNEKTEIVLSEKVCRNLYVQRK